MTVLGGWRLEEFQSCREVAEKVMHGDGGALRSAAFVALFYVAVLEVKIGAGGIAVGSG